MMYVVVTACLSDELEKCFDPWSNRGAEFDEYEVVSIWGAPWVPNIF